MLTKADIFLIRIHKIRLNKNSWVWSATHFIKKYIFLKISVQKCQHVFYKLLNRCLLCRSCVSLWSNSSDCTMFGSSLTSLTPAVSLSPAVCRLLSGRLTCHSLAQGRERERSWGAWGRGRTDWADCCGPAWSSSLISEHSSQTSLTDQNRKHASHHSYDSLQPQVQAYPEGLQTS